MYVPWPVVRYGQFYGGNCINSKAARHCVISNGRTDGQTPAHRVMYYPARTGELKHSVNLRRKDDYFISQK